MSDTALDAALVEAFLNTLADLRLLEFVDERPQDLARYGLASVAGAISVWTANPDAPQRLLVGSAVEGTTNRYGRIEGREAVVRLPEIATELLAMTAESFTEPRVPESGGGPAAAAAPPSGE